MPRLIDSSYGKCNVRLTKVVRRGPTHELFELTVRVVLVGAFDRLYTEGDNTLCITTDTMKNTIFALARQHEFSSPEELGVILVDHFLSSFLQVTRAEATVGQTLWSRIPVAGRGHDFAFTRRGTDVRTSEVRRARGGDWEIAGGLAGLEVLKSSGSSFVGYHKERYTTLKETEERIFATSVDATWSYTPAVARALAAGLAKAAARPARTPAEGEPAEEGAAQGLGAEVSGVDPSALFEEARTTLLEVFATHDSKSVQHTIYAIGATLLERIPEIASVDIAMPNQHRLLVDLAPFGLENDNEIFVATSEPYGLIKGSVARE